MAEDHKVVIDKLTAGEKALIEKLRDGPPENFSYGSAARACGEVEGGKKRSRFTVFRYFHRKK